MPYVQQRRGTASALASANEIPLAGQLVVETDTGKMKVGNGTTAYAGLEYITDASNITDGSIGTSKITDLNVTAGKLADGAVTTAKIADNAIASAKIATNAVVADKIAANAVGTSKIAADAITSAKIAQFAVDTTEIAAGAVETGKLDWDAVTTPKIADDAVTSAKIAANAVTNSEIAANTILNGNIAAGAINTQSITNDAVTYAKIQNVGAEKILGNDTASSGNVTEIASTAFGRSLLNSASSSALASTLGVATTSQITAAIDNLIDSAPGALNTLNELAAAIADDVAFSTTVTDSIATKLPLAGGTVTGDIDMSRSASSKTKIDWANSNGSANFSNAADDLDYIRLYSSGSTYAGMGITTSNFNIGTTGLVNLTVRTDGTVRTQYTSSGESHHYGLHKFDAPFFVSAGDTPTAPKVSVVGGTDTGLYFPATNNVAISASGDRKIDITSNLITLDRKGGQPTLKSSPNGVDGSAGGWMIIDSVTNPCSLNYYSGADVQLAYGGGGATVGTVGQGNYKFRVHGGTSHFSNALRVAADAVYAPVYQSSTDGTVGAAAYGRENDDNTGMFFPAADKVALTAGGVECIRGATTSGTTVVSTSHLIDTSNFIYANGYRAKNAGSAAATAYGKYNDGNTGMYFPADNEVAISAGGGTMMSFASGNVEVSQHFRIPDGTVSLPGIAFGTDTNTGIYQPADDQLAISTGGTVALRVSSAGSIAVGPHAPTDSYVIHISRSKTEQTSFQGIASVPSHAYGQAGTFNTLGVNGSALLTASANSIANSGYIRGLHGAATYYSRDSSSVAEVTGVHGLAQHASTSAGNGTVNTAYGVKGYYYESNPGGTTGTAFGVKANVNLTSNADATSAISNAYGMYTGVNSSYSGRITNGYGLYISVVQAANAWGVYQDQASIKNRFYGTVEHGGTTGSAGSYIPGITFLHDPDTGFGKNLTIGNVIDVICGGNIVGAFGPTGIRMIDGTASEPAFSFAGATSTGIKRNTNGNMDLVYGGANKISVTSAGSSLGGTVTMNHQISDGTTTATTASLMERVVTHPYGLNLLFG